jgi:hypothetical protein
LYFRLLKRISVLALLTKYLLLYKRVCIPHVGTFEIVYEPPQLDVGDRLFSPPYFTTRFRQSDKVPEHQFRFISAYEQGNGNLREELFSFGEQLNSRIRSGDFRWNGFGTLRNESSGIIFEPAPIGLQAFAPLQAQKVQRENVQHSVLVGDQQMKGQKVTEVLHKHTSTRSPAIIIAWIVLILALAAVFLMLYLGKFQTGASGLKAPVTGMLTLSKGIMA